MELLQEAMPEGVRPYTILSSHPIPEVLTAMAFCGEHYIAGGSKDNQVCSGVVSVTVCTDVLMRMFSNNSTILVVHYSTDIT